MSERQILFSGPMVRAILADRKTQTRRVLGADTGQFPGGEWRCCRAVDGSPSREWVYAVTGVARARMRCPYGAPGGRLWIRETWRYADAGHGPCVEYAAGGLVLGILRPDLLAAFPGPDTRWRSPIFMPRWASRLTLDVTGVRVERVQAITGTDVLAEGVGQPWNGRGIDAAGGMTDDHEGQLRDRFRRGWGAINGRRAGAAWECNPWVWVVSFRRLT